MTRAGLVCPTDCQVTCVIGSFRRVADRLGYLGVCVAAGGSMALRFVKESRAAGIVAVACAKELKEGIQGVREVFTQSNGEPDECEVPTVVVVGLTKDGCVDTEVAEDEVIDAMQLGCSSA